MRVFETYHACPSVDNDKLDYCCIVLQNQMSLPHLQRIGDFEKVNGKFKLVPRIMDRECGLGCFRKSHPFNFCPYCGQEFT